MALWEVNGEIVFSDGALSISKPEFYSFVRRHFYKVPYTNVGKGGFVHNDGDKYHVPSWTKVHPETTFDDIMVEENPFKKLFEEPQQWKFESSSGGKTYTVKKNKQGNLSCDCWGYIAHRKCKHITEVNANISTI